MTTARARIALVIHPNRQEARELAAVARAWWEARGYEVLETGAYDDHADAALLQGELAFAISLGGDGTMLRTVQLVVNRGVPVVGVNLGSLGYLTPIEPRALESAFTRLVAGDYEIEERMTLRVLVESDDARSARRLERSERGENRPGHTIRFGASIDDSSFLNYVADGIVIATPTGSTAYNLSLRGPIVSPRLRAIVVTPVAPHMLFDRSLVLEPDETIRLEILGTRPALLVVDGLASETLAVGAAVTIRAGPHPARIVHFGAMDFHAILRHKFGLTGR